MLPTISELSSKVSSLLKIQNSHPYYRRLLLFLFCASVSGLVLTLALFCVVLFSGDLTSKDFCLKNSCFEYFFKEISSVLALAQLVIGFMAFIATVGALFVALLGYLTADKTSKFTNYITHLTLFQSYFLNEIARLDFLSSSSFDIHRMYGFIFDEADRGVMSPSGKYLDFLKVLSDEIERSNKMASAAVGGSFRHLEHQGRMRRVFSEIGFDLALQPKSDYFEVETDLLVLIDSVNISFCRLESSLLRSRAYR